MNSLAPALALIQATEDRSLVRTMMEALPTDPASLFVLALVVGITGLVIYYGRKGGDGGATKKES